MFPFVRYNYLYHYVYRFIFILCFGLAYSGIGHFFSRVGRTLWWIVIEKYITFLKVVLGIWTDDGVDGYKLDRIAEIGTLPSYLLC